MFRTFKEALRFLLDALTSDISLWYAINRGDFSRKPILCPHYAFRGCSLCEAEKVFHDGDENECASTLIELVNSYIETNYLLHREPHGGEEHDVEKCAICKIARFLNEKGHKCSCCGTFGYLEENTNGEMVCKNCKEI